MSWSRNNSVNCVCIQAWGNSVGIRTHGAVTTVGPHTGVVSRLQANQPYAVGVRGTVHRLNPTSSKADDNVPSL